MYLVGITGKARTGKDTIAEHMALRHKFHRYSFAAPIKVACKAMFGWTEQHTEGELKEVVDLRFNISPRKAMQTLGTEFGREMVNPDMWVTRADVEYQRILNSEILQGYLNGMVVPDVRFENEAQWVRDNDGIIIHVTRSKAKPVNAHKSEVGIAPKDTDVIITNDGSIEDLYFQIDNVVEAMAMVQRRDYEWK